MHPSFPVVHRLVREPDAQVAARAFHHAEPASHHVVQHLVPTPVSERVHDRGVVLQVDPVRHDHRRGKDQLQHTELRVLFPPVLVQERAASQVHAARAVAGRHDERRIPGESPLGAHLRPVACSQVRRYRKRAVVAGRERLGRRRARAACAAACLREACVERRHECRMRVRHAIEVVQRHLVGRCVVQSRHHPRVAEVDPLGGEAGAHVRLGEQSSECARIHLARLSATRAAVQAGGHRVVLGRCAVAHEREHRRKITRKAHGAQDARRQCDARGQLDCAAVSAARERGPQRSMSVGRCAQRIARARAQPEAVAYERGRPPKPRRFDKRESGHGARSKPLPRERVTEPASRIDARIAPVRARVLRDQRRWEQPWQLRPRRTGERLVRDRQAEEPGEAERAHRRRDLLERATERLGADVDAEHDLRARRLDHRRTRYGRSCTELAGKFLLIGELQCALHDPVVAARCLRLNRTRGPFVLRGPPFGAPRGRTLETKQQELPREPHGQQVHERVVVLVRETRLPSPMGARRGPAVHGQKECREIALPRFGGHRERIERVSDERARIGREFCRRLSETAKSHEEPRAAIVRGERAPERIKAARTVGRPTRLSLVEEGSARLAHMARHVLGP